MFVLWQTKGGIVGSLIKFPALVNKFRIGLSLPPALIIRFNLDRDDADDDGGNFISGTDSLPLMLPPSPEGTTKEGAAGVANEIII